MATAFRSGTSGADPAPVDRGTCTGLSDARLLERFVTRGDEAAFAALVSRHGCARAQHLPGRAEGPGRRRGRVPGDVRAALPQGRVDPRPRCAGAPGCTGSRTGPRSRPGPMPPAVARSRGPRADLAGRRDPGPRRPRRGPARGDRAAPRAVPPAGRPLLSRGDDPRPGRRFICDAPRAPYAAGWPRAASCSGIASAAAASPSPCRTSPRAVIPESLVATTVRTAAGAVEASGSGRGDRRGDLAAAGRVTRLAGTSWPLWCESAGRRTTAIVYQQSGSRRRPPGRNAPLRPVGSRRPPRSPPSPRPGSPGGPSRSDDPTSTTAGRGADPRPRRPAGRRRDGQRPARPVAPRRQARRLDRRGQAAGQAAVRPAHECRTPGRQQPSSATTGRDGRFRIDGLPRDAIVTASITGPGIETSEVYILTREMPTIRVKDPMVRSTAR